MPKQSKPKPQHSKPKHTVLYRAITTTDRELRKVIKALIF